MMGQPISLLSFDLIDSEVLNYRLGHLHLRYGQ